ncbi:MAG: LPS export ABC transporter periplasmic protein LptC [Bacteroidales bacterium]|nr:LPS export ABC transporter periplasmic protein LptC [Bacteroidales bacterium]
MRLLPIGFIAAVMCSGVVGCSDDKQSYVQNVGDGETTPTMLTYNVDTYISDSGYTRYYIKTPIWAMYEEAKDPNWKFPETLEMEQYDRDMNITSTMRCDSAMYLSQKRIWRLDGNVVMVNTQGDSFLTQQVFWNQAKREVYSDSFIHIVRSDRIIEGYGFTSNEPMTAYTVNRPTGIFPAERSPQSQSKAETTPDSAKDHDPHRRQPSRRISTPTTQPIPLSTPDSLKDAP